MYGNRIKRLPENIRKNGYEYKLMEKDDKRAIYSQHLEDGKIIAYEVFRILPKKPHPKALEDIKNYDRVETFPTDEDFGRRAWTYKKIEDAKKKFDSL